MVEGYPTYKKITNLIKEDEENKVKAGVSTYSSFARTQSPL